MGQGDNQFSYIFIIYVNMWARQYNLHGVIIEMYIYTMASCEIVS